MPKFNRFEEQCQYCSCYIENWDDELDTLMIDGDCSLEQYIHVYSPCFGFDDIRERKRKKVALVFYLMVNCDMSKDQIDYTWYEEDLLNQTNRDCLIIGGII